MSDDGAAGHGGADLRDRFRGALVGTLVGDALGMPLEGAPPPTPGREVREMLDAREGRGTGTDDTQMTVALAEALAEMNDPSDPDLDRVAERFGAHFDPRRGYGGNTRRILAAVRTGEPWREVVERHRLPGGSYANGAAMRAAPAALAGYPRFGPTARIADLQGRVTGHTHPGARFGARLQAVAVLDALLRPSGEAPAHPLELLERAEEGTETGERLPAPDAYRRALAWIADGRDVPPREAARRLGTGSRADESVPAALWAFHSRSDDAEATVVRAVNLGGDADTIGAMAGALAGARHGTGAFPERWVNLLEEGSMGRRRLEELADRLFDRTAGDGAADGRPTETRR